MNIKDFSLSRKIVALMLVATVFLCTLFITACTKPGNGKDTTDNSVQTTAAQNADGTTADKLPADTSSVTDTTKAAPEGNETNSATNTTSATTTSVSSVTTASSTDTTIPNEPGDGWTKRY